MLPIIHINSIARGKMFFQHKMCLYVIVQFHLPGSLGIQGLILVRRADVRKPGGDQAPGTVFSLQECR